MASAVDFLIAVGKLKRLKRTGWVRSNVRAGDGLKRCRNSGLNFRMLELQKAALRELAARFGSRSLSLTTCTAPR